MPAERYMLAPNPIRRTSAAAACILLLSLLSGCASAPESRVADPGAPGVNGVTHHTDNAALPRTRAERTDYQETSHYADVVQFLDSLRSLGAPIRIDTLGVSTEGRVIPLVVASRPLVSSPAEARQLGRPIVYVQGNIHAGEIEGKEAVQMLLRDLSFSERPNVLDSIVLVAVPIYNADGNEKFGPLNTNRPEQNGPAMVGLRPNGQGLDLNRDYIKAEAPETRASLAAFNRWDPDVFVDLHTTNGSYHGYALTYSPSLNPAAGEAGIFTRDELLPELRRRMRERHGFETFAYGNFALEYGADVNTDTVRQGWFTYDHRPRFGTNYYGLRGRVSILSEAYSHDPFERRVASTYAFVSEILSLASERTDRLRALRSADAAPAAGVPVRSALTETPIQADVIAEDLVADPDSVPDEPGVHRGLRRTGQYRTLRVPVYDRFTPSLHRTPPEAYALRASDTTIVRLLRSHGVRVDTIAGPMRVRVEVFSIDSVVRAPRPFQGYHEVRLEGRWRTEPRTLPARSFLVPTNQPLSVVATYLLEPESDDGVATWSSPAAGAVRQRPLFGDELRAGGEFPVVRVEVRE
jgi:hypothetical protein